MTTPTAKTDVPVYVGMPPTDRTFEVKPFGSIRCGGKCRDDYDRLKIDVRDGGQVKLQRAALAAFLEAERQLGYEITLTGSWRSCSYQTELYRTDHNRYAPPATTAHCRGLAIDVSTALSAAKLKAIRNKLEARGWTQARPDDEPWHYSFGIRV